MELFRSPCETCRGAGTLVCKHCHGSKIRKKFPVKYGKKANEHPLYKYECYVCGPYSPNDFTYENTPDDVGTLNVMANLKAAMCNRTRPHPYPASAGWCLQTSQVLQLCRPEAKISAFAMMGGNEF